MRCPRYGYLLLAAIVMLVGSVLIQSKDQYVGLSELSGRLDATRRQMAAMAPYVREYAKEHGHYPSNDEGLLAVPRLVEACKSQEHS